MAQPLTQEIGYSSAQANNGFTFDLALRELTGARGRQLLHEMRDTDPTAGAMVTAIELPCRAVDWSFEPANDSAEAKELVDFAQSVRDDMSHSWADFLTDALTMATFGWSAVECVWKRRVGPDQADPSRRSEYTDGRIGLRKLAGRSQLTLSRWELDEGGGVQAFVQASKDAKGEVPIPIERLLLFRTTREASAAVEGRSVLKSAYLPWRARREVEQTELIGIRRELTGVPICRIPVAYFQPRSDAAEEVKRQSIYNAYVKIASDLRFNDAGGLVIPSDPFMDADGKPTGVRQFEIDLIASAGTRTMDTGATIGRLDVQMARSILADFLMLGAGKQGSFALSKDKTDFFTMSITWLVDVVEDVINRHLMPRLWLYNGLPRDLMPKFKHGEVTPVDLEKLGNYVRSITGAGVTIADDETQNQLRRVGDLPELEPEQFTEIHADEKEAARLALEAQRAALNDAAGKQDDAATGAPPAS